MATSAAMLAPLLRETAKAVFDNYNPRKNWASTAQPVPGLRKEDYCALAKAAQPACLAKDREFLNTHGYSFIEITHKEFLVYENGSQDFDKWFSSLAKAKGLNPRVDIILVKPCVKSLSAAGWKATHDDAGDDRTRDYLRSMMIRRNCGRSPQEHVRDVKKLISEMESSDTIAYKNQYYEPYDTGYRGFKAVGCIDEIPSIILLNGKPASILRERKIESEAEMPIHRLTRKLINLDRKLEDNFKNFYKRAAEKASNLTGVERAESRIRGSIERVAGFMYDNFYARYGYNELLGHKSKEAHATVMDAAILMNHVKLLPLPARKLIIESIQESGVLSKMFPKLAMMHVGGTEPHHA